MYRGCTVMGMGRWATMLELPFCGGSNHMPNVVPRPMRPLVEQIVYLFYASHTGACQTLCLVGTGWIQWDESVRA